LHRFITLLLLLVLPLAAAAQSLIDTPYKRHYFGRGWVDSDRDCLNTRHELLLAKSVDTTPVLTKNHCRVLRGKWYDPFDDKTVFDASHLDIDHIIPLKWAWEHGADHWTRDQRKQFANDLRFIIAVSGSLNRSKGAKAPTEWMPPNASYHCTYVTIFYRAILVYDFSITDAERRALKELRSTSCNRDLAFNQ